MKKNKGITLISLIITIIMLIILVGVTIISINGEDNVRDKAEDASKKYSSSIEKEASDLTYINQDLENGYKYQKLQEEIYVNEVAGPDLTGFSQENTYLAVYNSDATAFTNFVKLSTVKDDLVTFIENNNWYDYENQKWANIKIVENDIETWWTWIPRYAYKIEGTATYVQLVSKENLLKNGSIFASGYELAPIFENGDGLRGIWVSKYEPSNKNGSVEIKNTIDVYTNINISDCYIQSRDINKNGQGLQTTAVNTHMANNREWATVSYFSNSPYGTNMVGQNTGVSITIDEITYYSTNGNITGVMDWGKTLTYTAGILKERLEKEASGVGVILLNAYGIDKIVEAFDASISIDYKTGRAGLYSNPVSDRRTDYPFSVRNGLFGFTGGTDFGWNYRYIANGRGPQATFRPVIYN